MGIYGVKSNTCNCQGSWSTLDSNDHRIYMERPCKEHKIIVGNTIYYQLKYLLNHIINNFKDIKIKEKYAVKILEIEKVTDKTIIKIEVNHNGEFNVNNFNDNKQIFYSQMNDEPMWKKIDDNILHMIILYQAPHHSVEEQWEPSDY